MSCTNLIKKTNTFFSLKKELEIIQLKQSANRSYKEQEITLRFDTLSTNIRRFLDNESMRSVIKDLCFLYSDILSVSNNSLAYRGSVPASLTITFKNAPSITEQCVNAIKASCKILAQKSGDFDKEIKKLCVAFVTLKTINTKIDELKSQAITAALEEENAKIETIKSEIAQLLKEYPLLADEEKLQKHISLSKKSVLSEIDRFNFNNISVPEDYSVEISVPFARNTRIGEYETGITYWNPIKDGILHINVPCGKYEIASNFIIALTMQFLHSYPLMKKQISYCCQNSLSKMDSFLTSLKDICKESVFFKGIEQFESDAFYQGINDHLKDLRNEIKHRSSLIDDTSAENIYAYNSLADVDILSPILVFLHDYPTGFSACKDLGYFFRESARYGIFFVIIQTDFSKNHIGNGICDPMQYCGIHCTLHEDEQIEINGAIFESVSIEKQKVRPLLEELVNNAQKGNKTSYLSYEDIGFGATELNADGYCTKISIPIGRVNNKLFSLDFATSPSDEDRKKGIHTPLAYLVMGGPGSGKSTLIDSLVINGSMAYSPDDVIFYLLDFKDGVTASFYDGENAIPHVRMIAAQSKEEDSDIILSGLIAEKERRNDLFKSCGTADIAGYNAKSEKKIPRIIVIVDECQNLFASDILAEKCEKLAREGRSSGIHLVLASQDAKRNMMQHAGKFIDGRFCFFTPDSNDAAQLISSTYTKSLANDVPKGSGLAWMSLENGENCNKIQIAFHGGDKTGNKNEYNRQIREKWKKVNYGIHLIKAGEKTPLMLHKYSNSDNPLLCPAPMIANIGENYFDHSTFGINFSKEASHSVLILGDDEKPSSDILTSLITCAISMGGKIKLIDESMNLSLSSFFASHPSVNAYTKDEYLNVLKDVYDEFERRKQDFRSKYSPLFFIINCLHRIDDYRLDKRCDIQDSKQPDMSKFSDMRAFYAANSSNVSAAKSISGKSSLLSMLSDSEHVGNMYIIVTSNSISSNSYDDEKRVFSNCGYKILQNKVNAGTYRIMDDSFKNKMMNGMNENMVFVSNQGEFTKCRYFQYDWKNKKTTHMIKTAAIKRNNS